jgi:putative hydrolase
MTRELGKRIDLHMHTIFSDGALLPAALVREAEVRGHEAIALTDHVDSSNIEDVTTKLVNFTKKEEKNLPIKVLPGVELSYLLPRQLEEYAKLAKKLGAKVIVVHGESPVEQVYPGTNLAALKCKGLVNILAHPGNTLTLDEAKLAAENGIYLELSNRRGHREGNKHVAELAKKAGAKMLVDTDAHCETDLITQEQAYKVALEAGLNEDEAIKVIKDNPRELLNSLK